MQVAKDLPGGVSDKKRCSQVVVFELKKEKLENNKTEKLPFDETHFMALAAPIPLEWLPLKSNNTKQVMPSNEPWAEKVL